MKKMPLDEFQKIGLVQEINRQFLHPMGLSLGFYTRSDGKNDTVLDVTIQDAREDPEGMFYDAHGLNKERAEKVREMFEAKRKIREEKFGYHIQPIE